VKESRKPIAKALVRSSQKKQTIELKI